MIPNRERWKARPAANSFDFLAGWLTLMAALAILCLTLFPFDFSPAATALRRSGPFFAWFIPVADGWHGWLLNILLFVPLGVGLAWWTGAKGWRRSRSCVAAGMLGLLLSFSVEFLQIDLRQRASSWDDVLTNTLGSLVGCFLFQVWGGRCLRYVEDVLEEMSATLDD